MRWIILFLVVTVLNAEENHIGLHLVSRVPIPNSEEFIEADKSGDRKIYISSYELLSKDDIEDASFSLSSITNLIIQVKEKSRVKVVGILANTPHDGLVRKEGDKYVLPQTSTICYFFDNNLIRINGNYDEMVSLCKGLTEVEIYPKNK